MTIVDVQPRSAPAISECWLSKGRPLVKWKATEGLAQVYRWIEEGRDRGAWIDLEIDVEQSLTLEETHRLRKLYDGFVHIRPNYLKRTMLCVKCAPMFRLKRCLRVFMNGKQAEESRLKSSFNYFAARC